MRRMKDLLRQRQGVTLAELMAASALMCVVLGMAAACVHPAAAALRRTHQLQEAQLILDTVLIVGWPSIDIEVLLSSVLKML